MKPKKQYTDFHRAGIKNPEAMSRIDMLRAEWEQSIKDMERENALINAIFIGVIVGFLYGGGLLFNWMRLLTEYISFLVVTFGTIILLYYAQRGNWK